MPNQTTIPLFYSVNDVYVDALEVSLRSLIANAKSDRHYQVRVLNQGLTPVHQKQLTDLTTAKVSVELVSIADTIRQQITDHGNKLRADYFTFTIYFRLFIADLFPDLTKAIYLDADTLILADVAELFDTKLGDHLVAAACDPFIAKDPTTAAYAEGSVGVPANEYVNSGVLVMNLALMRQLKFSQHFLTLLNKYHFPSIAPDQDYINAICHDRLIILSPSWNVQEKDIKSAPKLVHYNLYKKPWHYQEVPYGKEFWQYAEGATGKANLQATRAAFTAQDKATDDQHMQDMLSKARATTGAAGSFAETQKKTGEVRL